MRIKLYFAYLFISITILASGCVGTEVRPGPISGVDKLSVAFDYKANSAKSFPGRLPDLHVGQLFVGESSASVVAMGTLNGWDVNHDGAVDFYEFTADDGRTKLLAFDFDGDGDPDQVSDLSH